MTEERAPQVGDVFIDGWSDVDGPPIAICLFSWHPLYSKLEAGLSETGPDWDRVRRTITVELDGIHYEVRDLRRGEIGPNGTVVR